MTSLPPRACALLALSVLATFACAAAPAPAGWSSSDLGATRARRPPAAESLADVSVMLDSVVRRGRVPGMVALVMSDGRIVARGAAGVRHRGEPGKLAFDDTFLLCSAGKAMVATLAAMAVDDGTLSWSSSPADVLAAPDRAVNDGWRHATLAQLLEHRAGAASELDRKWWVFRAEWLTRGEPASRREDVVHRMLAAPPAYRPGTRYVYSSLDYLVVCAMLERTSGRSCEQLVRERLWSRLGIRSAYFGSPGANGNHDTPAGHLGMLLVGRPAAGGGFWSLFLMPRSFGPVSASSMTITDWARFVALHLRGDAANPHRETSLLSASSFDSLHAASATRPYFAGWTYTTREWARGRREPDSGRVLISEGDNGLWHSEAWIAPEVDFAVLVLINQGGPAHDQPASLASREVVATLAGMFSPSSATRAP